MTRAKYLQTKLLIKLGIGPSDRVRVTAATEAHLLRDAEGTIGNLAWEDVESIDNLSSDYWELRKLAKRHHEISAKIEPIAKELQLAQESRKALLENNSDKTSSKSRQRDENKRQSERLGRERTSIIAEGLELRRKLNGLQTKIEVISEESSGTSELQLQNARSEITENEERFEKLRRRRSAVEDKIKQLHEEETQLSEDLEREERGTKDEMKAQFNEISRLNKELTDYGNELGGIHKEAEPLYTSIGKYLISHAYDSEVKTATKKHRALLKLVDKIQDSYTRNQELLKR